MKSSPSSMSRGKSYSRHFNSSLITGLISVHAHIIEEIITEYFTLPVLQLMQCYIYQEMYLCVRLTGEPWAAGSARRAFRRSSAAVGEVGAPRHSWRSCSAVAGVMADLTHTAPVDSSQSAPTTAAHSPLPTATPRHAGKQDS